MKWCKNRQTASADVIFVESVVDSHGSIFLSFALDERCLLQIFSDEP